MKRQSVRRVVDDYSSTVEYYPGVIKFILGNNTYYLLSNELSETTRAMWKAELITLPSSPSSDEEVLSAVINGDRTGIMAVFHTLLVVNSDDTMVQIGNPTTKEYLYVLFLNGGEFIRRFSETLKN